MQLHFLKVEQEINETSFPFNQAALVSQNPFWNAEQNEAYTFGQQQKIAHRMH